MNYIIIATHSTLAEGFYNAVCFFNNECNNVEFINCYVDDEMNCEKQLRDSLEKHIGDNVVICTDMMGGSVNQFATKLLREYDFFLVSGVNLSLILELMFSLDDFTKENIVEKVELSRENIVLVNQFSTFETNSEDEDEL